MDLTEAEDIKKRRQKYTKKKCTKKIFRTQIITMVCDHSPRARYPET